MTGEHIYTIVSDNDKDMGILDGLKKRFIDQKFCYINDAANLYYAGYQKHDKIVKEEKNKIIPAAINYLEIMKKHIPYGKSIAFISLGCGNGDPEKESIKSLSSSWYDINYFAVDYSREMLELAIKNYEDINCPKQFICADVWSQDFVSIITGITETFDSRVFSFLWFTFIALDQLYFIDSIYSILKKGDLFLFDILIRKDDTKKTLISFFERYNAYLENADLVERDSSILKYAWINPNDWYFWFDYFQEKWTWAYIYRSFFQFDKKIIIKFKNQQIIFLPWEKITLSHRRNYNREQFEYFIEEHGFHYVDHIDHQVQDYVTNSCYLYAK